MRNKDKNKKKKKSVNSPSSPTRNITNGRANQRDNACDLRQQQDDYGFLVSSKGRMTKAASNGEFSHNSKRQSRSGDRRLEVAEQYGYTNQVSTPNRNDLSLRSHEYNKQIHQQFSEDNNNSKRSTLTFYPHQVVERQSRSASRPSHDRSRRDDSGNARDVTDRPDRSRSKSRDIVTLYTTANNKQRSRSSTPAGSLQSYLYYPPSLKQPQPRSRSCTPARSLASYQYYPQSSTPTNNASRSGTPAYSIVEPEHYRRSRSLARNSDYKHSASRLADSDSHSRRAKSESRCRSISRDAVSLYSNLSTQSRALSNSEIATQNLELWMTTTSKNQRPSSKTRKPEKRKDAFVTLLEMDPRVNETSENLLNNASELKPANIKMMMIAGHVPASHNWENEDEIEVKSGAIITGLFKQNEWLYVSIEDSSRGYVPYAYTKPIKITPLLSSDRSSTKKALPSNSHSNNMIEINHQTPSTVGILKESKVAQRKQFTSKYNHPIANNQAERDSLSSSNSVFLEELLCARPPTIPRATLQPKNYADCLVVDTDHKFDGMGFEDVRAYCSDSGISEPNSNHSDELDQYVSLSNSHPHHHHITSTLNGSTSFQSSPSHGHIYNVSIGAYQRNHYDSQSLHRPHRDKQTVQNSHSHINSMPLGPLGERLQRSTKITSNHYEHPIYYNLSQDMKSRAQTSAKIPQELKPRIPKDYNGPRVRVVYDYKGENEDDIEVRAGEVVTTINSEDVEWIWVMRRDGVEGFMPREYVLPMDIQRPMIREERTDPSTHPYLVVAL